MIKINFFDMFANPKTIQSLSFYEKMMGSIYTAIIGMGITFLALIIIWLMIKLLSNGVKFFESLKEVNKKDTEDIKIDNVSYTDDINQDIDEIDEEIIAVIMSAIASDMNTSTNNIVIKNIVMKQDTTWALAGRIEQMDLNF